LEGVGDQLACHDRGVIDLRRRGTASKRLPDESAGKSLRLFAGQQFQAVVLNAPVTKVVGRHTSSF
jgi:hypothetical protein